MAIWGKKATTDDRNPTLVAGLELYDAGDFAGAIPPLLERVRDSDAFAAFKLANALFEIDQPRAAIAFWELAILWGNKDSYNNLANRYKDEKFLEKAYELYVLGAENGSDDAMHSAGVVALDLGKENEGIAWLQKGMTEGNLRCYAVLGKHLFDSGQQERALEVLEAGVSKSSLSCLLQMGLIFHNKEEYPQALEVLLKALEIEEIDVREKHLEVFVHGLLAAIYSTQGEFENGVKHAEIASKLGSKDADTLLESLRPALKAASRGLGAPVKEIFGKTRTLPVSKDLANKTLDLAPANLRPVKFGHFSKG